jgi:hypothetical protein
MSVFADYLLIGEEIFAASAMISRNNRVVATLASQDWLKLICVTLMLLGVILGLAKSNWLVNLTRL